MSHSSTSVTVQVDVSTWTDEQRQSLFGAIAHIGNSTSGPVLPDLTDVETTGWTLDAYHDAMTGLLGKYQAQAMVIGEAIKNGTGFVPREQVYELAGYDPAKRSLKGFTRPVNRVVANLVDKGVLPEDVADLMKTEYDPAIKGFQRTLGFSVPLEVVKILQDVKHAKQNSAV